MPEKKSTDQKNEHPKEGARSVDKNSKSKAEPPIGKKRKVRKKRRWKVIFIWLFLIIAGLFVLLNGPITRHYGQKFLDDALREKGIDGQATIDGTLLQGLSLRNVAFKDLGSIKRLTASEIKLHYSLGDLLQKRVHSIEGNGLSLLIETKTEKDPDEIKEPFSLDKLHLNPEIPRLIDKHLTPIGLDFRQTNLTFTNAGNPLWQSLDLHLTHLPGHRHLTLTYKNVTDLDGKTFSPPKTRVYYTDHSLAIDSLPLAKDLSLSAQADLEPTEKATPSLYQVNVHFSPGNADTYLQISSEHFENLKAELSGTPIDSATLPDFLNFPVSPRFSIRTLNANIPRLTNTPADWLGEAHLELTQYRDHRYTFDLPLSIDLARTAEDQFSIKALLPDHPNETELPSSTELQADLTVLDGWSNGVCNVTAEGKSARWLLETINLKAPKSLKNAPTVWPDTAYEATALLYWENSQLLNITGEGNFQGLQYPDSETPTPLLLTYFWENDLQRKKASTISANVHPLGETPTLENQLIAFKGHFDPNANRAGLALVTDLEKDNLELFAPLLASYGIKDIPLDLLNAQWSSSLQMKSTGDKPKRHKGTLKITNALLNNPKSSLPPTRINGELNYNHEKEIQIKSLHLLQKDLHLYAEGGLKDSMLGLTRLNLDKERPDGSKFNLLKAAARLPINFKAKSLDDFTAQEGEINAYLEANELRISDLQSLFQRPLNIKGTLNTNLTLRGTLQEPVAKGRIALKDFVVLNQPDVPQTDIELDLGTNSKKHLTLNGKASPDGYPPLQLSGAFPFTPWKWSNDATSFQKTPFSIQANAQNFPLNIVGQKVDAFKRFEATSNLNIIISGSIEEPQINGGARIDLAHLQLKDGPIPAIRDVPINLTFDKTLISIQPVTLNLLGGQYGFDGTVDITNRNNPDFNFNLSADNGLLWRNDSFTSRANARLNLAGSLNQSHLSGHLDIIESLFYREIEILPIGSATKTKEPPKLPGFKKANSSNTLPVPAPFKDWTLDIVTRTADPILVRGNLATADINGQVKLTGTLGQPLANGKLDILKAEATLPFSRMKVAKGSVRFTGKNLLNPIIEIRGNSVINAYDITLNLSGPANRTKTLLSSNPPLPEHDILALLATGVTTSGLEDQETASTKALQFLLERLRANPPGGPNTALARFLAETRDVQLAIGEKSPFTGRQFSSATVPLHERWFISAAVDEDRRTRGLLLYVIRFH